MCITAGISKVHKFAAGSFETSEHRHRHLQGPPSLERPPSSPLPTALPPPSSTLSPASSRPSGVAAGITKVLKFAAGIFENPEHHHLHLQGPQVPPRVEKQAPALCSSLTALPDGALQPLALKLPTSPSYLQDSSPVRDLAREGPPALERPQVPPSLQLRPPPASQVCPASWQGFSHRPASLRSSTPLPASSRPSCIAAGISKVLKSAACILKTHEHRHRHPQGPKFPPP